MDADQLFPEDDGLAAAVGELVGRYGYSAVRVELDMHLPLRPVPSAPARATDPETSQLAGPHSTDLSRFSARSRQARLLTVLLNQSLTDQQAALRVMGPGAVPSRLEGCRRRMSDLRAVGYVCDSGYRRRNPGTDDLAIVWRLTEAGKEALSRLHATGWSR